ncbi:HEAT repeat-containing protein 5B [Oryzias melastigma]|uniref:HEAT repeat-containing protein 5B n=2 Tax=Oryzias melastigma TaxID=30732 RepID=A0A834C4S1_ORYME|nr:HEAT repeat-containing protein 5B [Oryzias melastigma]
MLGVSIEFLCFPRPEEPIEHVISCLQALCTLLETPCVKKHIAEDQLLAVELLNVLHRLLLTRDPPAVQLHVTAVVQETIRAAQDHLQQQRANKGKDEESEKDSQSSLGEGGETGELVPGKSLVYATMELLVFILVRHLPQLNSRVKESPSHVPLRPQRLSEESARLVANTVSILAELPLLCSAAGGMTILPTVLFLITGVLRDTAIKTPDNSVPLPVAAALQGIKVILTSPMARVESIQTRWTALVRSSLASVLEYSQPDESRPDMDEVSMLTAIPLFLLSASNELVGVVVLQKGCIDRFRNALNSSDPWVQARCYQLLLSVFQHSNRALSTPYIHALAPLMVEKLKAVERSRPGSAAELQAVQEGIRVLENLVSMGEEKNRVQLLALLVPTLISYLLDENAISSAPQVSRSLHDFALQNLMRIGPLYPAAFKTVIGAAPELKTRLESAIRANQASSKAKAAARQAQPAVQAAPTIKLKTSFF